MDELRRGEAQQLMQPDLTRGRAQQIAAAHNFGDTLKGVVDHDGQLVGKHAVRAANDEVAALGGQVLGAFALQTIGKGNGAVGDGQTCRRFAGLALLCDFVRCQIPTGTRVDDTTV